MTDEELILKLTDIIVNFDVDNVSRVVEKALKAGIPPYEIVNRGLAKGITIVGQRYEKGEYFLPELVMAGEAMKRGIKILEPLLKSDKSNVKGKVVVGTVAGDIHNIGKDLLITFLAAAGFEVYDLGVNVPAEKFVEKVKETKAPILCLSALLTTSIPEMKNVIDALKQADLRNQVKVVVGGNPVSEEVAKRVGADLYGGEAIKGVDLIINQYFLGKSL